MKDFIIGFIAILVMLYFSALAIRWSSQSQAYGRAIHHSCQMGLFVEDCPIETITYGEAKKKYPKYRAYWLFMNDEDLANVHHAYNISFWSATPTTNYIWIESAK